MGLTRFPHGILATPNLGTDSGGYGRLVQLWESDNIWFVDGDNDSVGHAGNTPDASVALISTAVGLASKGGTIYVKPRLSDTSAQSYYYDTIEIPLSKPGMSIIGAGTPSSRAGVQLKPSTDHLAEDVIVIKGGGVTLENMRLTGNGGTADQYKSIVSAISVTGSSNPDGLTIRHCRFEGDKSVPRIASSTDMNAAVALGTASYSTIEDNTFYSCHGGIVGQLATAAYHNVTITRNLFSGAPANRVCDVFLMHGTTGGVVITHNIFADGLPTHAPGASGNYFVKITDAGTGILAWNAFATTADGEVAKAAGSECIIPATYFTAGNVYEGAASEGDGFCRRT